MKKTLAILLAMCFMLGILLTSCKEKKKPEDVCGEYELIAIDITPDENSPLKSDRYLINDVSSIDDENIKAIVETLIAIYSNYKFEITKNDTEFKFTSYEKNNDGQWVTVINQTVSVQIPEASTGYSVPMSSSVMENFMDGHETSSAILISDELEYKAGVNPDQSIRDLVKDSGLYSAHAIFKKK